MMQSRRPARWPRFTKPSQNASLDSANLRMASASLRRAFGMIAGTPASDKAVARFLDLPQIRFRLSRTLKARDVEELRIDFRLTGSPRRARNTRGCAGRLGLA